MHSPPRVPRDRSAYQSRKRENTGNGVVVRSNAVNAGPARGGRSGGAGVLFVVFGAGASFDSINPVRYQETLTQAWGWRPPLAIELLEPRARSFGPAMSQFPDAGALFMRVQSAIERKMPVEQAIQEAYDDISDTELGMRQLAGLRFYLQEVIWESGSRWSAAASSLTNYKLLADRIERWRSRHGETVAYATFNYDLMLEEALRPFLDLAWGTGFSNYTNGPTRVYKVHGSVDWGHPVAIENDYGIGNHRGKLIQEASSWEAAAHEWRRFMTWKESQPSRASSDRNLLMFPAIALPTTGKAGFECPSEHLKALHEDVANMDRLLVVGWKGQEEHFMKVLGRQAGRVEAHVVSGGAKEAIDVGSRIARRVKSLRLVPFGGGFSDYVQQGAIDALLGPIQ
jgi:hypothetical protein